MLVGRPCIHFFTECFNAKGVKCDQITSWGTLVDCIIEHTHLNSFRNRYASISLKNSKSVVVYCGLNANFTLSSCFGALKEDGLVDPGGVFDLGSFMEEGQLDLYTS